MGNLTKATHHGLVTRYDYNSLGKVISESRPRVSNASSSKKLRTYRLDGALTAHTTYDYSGSLVGAETNGIAKLNSYTTSFSIDSGNVIAYSLNKLGHITGEQSRGFFKGSTQREYFADYETNGLGQRVKRQFYGASDDIYIPLRRPNGDKSGGSFTFWRYDQNGNLVEKWDQAGDSTKQNHFEYEYSLTNKETKQYRTVEVRVAPEWREGEIADGALIGATNGYVSTEYNERDLKKNVIVRDNSPRDAATVAGHESWSTEPWSNQTYTRYDYFNDGRLYKTTVWLTGTEENPGQYVVDGTKIFEYDQRGRETLIRDSNGDGEKYDVTYADGTKAKRFAPSTNKTFYSADGTVTQEIWSDTNADNSLTCKSRLITKPTVGGLPRETTTFDACSSNKISKESVYDESGKATQDVSYNYRRNNKSLEYDYEYDEYGDIEEVKVYTTSRVLQSRTKNIYNGMGALEKIEVYSPNYSGARTTEYALDSRGNRIGVVNSRDRFKGSKKLYDPDGRVAEFHLADRRSGDMEGQQRLYFRYDPTGIQVLAADGQLLQDRDDGEHFYYLLNRKSYTTVAVAGDVQFIRVRTGFLGYEDTCSVFFCITQGEKRQDSWTKTAGRFKNETYSLADGTSDKNKGWELLQPYDVVAETALPLEAPKEAISDRLGVMPADVLAPEDASPDVGDITDVQAPQDGADAIEGEKGNDGSLNLSSPTSTLSNLSVLQSLSGDEDDNGGQNEESQDLGTLSSLPAVDEATASTSQQTANTPFDLQDPESALPAGLAEVQASDVVAPESVTSDLPNVGDATEVQAPGTSTPPPLGTSPSDGPLDVAPPASVQGPSAPEIGDGTPGAIGAVAPPIGWEPEKSDEVFVLQNEDENYTSPGCPTGYISDRKGRCKYKSSEVNEGYLENIKKRDSMTGANANPTHKDAEEERERVASSIAVALPARGDAFVKQQIDDIYESLEGMSPSEKISVLRHLEHKVVTGNYNEYEDARQKTVLDEAWGAATGKDGGNFTHDPSRRKYAVASIVGADFDLLSGGSGKTKAGILDYHEHQGNLEEMGVAEMLQMKDEDFLDLFGATKEAILGVGAVRSLAEQGLKMPASMTGANTLKVIKKANGALIIVGGALDAVVSVNKYDNPEDRSRALNHAIGRTAASAAAGSGVVAVGMAYTPACGPYAPACAVGVVVVGGVVAFGTDMLMRQEEVFGFEWFGWNY